MCQAVILKYEKRQARKSICGSVFHTVLQNVCMCFSVCVCHSAAAQMFRSLHLYMQRHVLAWDCCQDGKSLS